MTDREMLELAAKAAGNHSMRYCALWKAMAIYDESEQKYHGESWNPLTDDGDALRLAVKLCLELDICHSGIAVRTSTGHKVLVSPEDEADPYAATRRAIVRAAAEIGRAIG